MTTLTLQIKKENDLNLLLPLIKRLRIVYSSRKKRLDKKIREGNLQTYYKIINEGAPKLNIDDMLDYLTETRKDRTVSVRK